MSPSTESAETRYAHLLQPIKDLASSFNIDIKSDLQAYLSDLDEIQSRSDVNFAQAALLLQGSTMIFSRKVEYLYSLVYQSMEKLSFGDDEGGRRTGHDARRARNNAALHGDKLVVLDNFLQEGRGIDMEEEDERAQELRAARVSRRVPLWLMPREEGDKNRHEFKIAGCHVHSTGALLLDETDAERLDKLLREAASPSKLSRTPLAPTPPCGFMDKLLGKYRAQAEAPAEDCTLPLEPNSPGGQSFADELPPPDVPVGVVKGDLRFSTEEVEEADQWKPLNPHEVCGKNKPCKVTKRGTEKRPSKHLLTALTDLAVCQLEVLLDPFSTPADLHLLTLAPDAAEKAAARTSIDRHAYTGLVAGRLGFSEDMWIFEEALCAAVAKRKHETMLLRKKLGASPDNCDLQRDSAQDRLLDDSDHEGYGDDAPGALDHNGPHNDAFGDEPTAGSSGSQPDAEEDDIEKRLLAAQRSYEEIIRKQLEKMSTHQELSKGHAELFANVRQWQDLLEPMLEEQHKRPNFDIHVYGQDILDAIRALSGGSDCASFLSMVRGSPRWEVCRRFLATLVLTNHGNTAIHADSRKHFRVEVLNGTKDLPTLEEAPEEEVAAPPAKKKAKSAEGDAVPGAKENVDTQQQEDVASTTAVSAAPGKKRKRVVA
mmetsp:Transcript_56368/g.123514  ORF Transcript_56368/g.123514 Transcript_56368/m.123514 type:complete len:656 (-) Transcript_56368:167-2134(-)|eukprot:CAMPEP_0204270898 /NCGR_PEP_ID=MMETSP0468-20130131/19153_1 /ASSEMBLY_ACC=CAM_ASM_000383 /TAXON_ID=2969 /ORGANISM="Oxyrrhis marina" /LENGTH=655 /DNA_ID=CAMNT_0051246489 /DNA_START=41 /DNA_END=2008 /DNA_ORIENTATION=+